MRNMSRKGLAKMIKSIAFADQETKRFQVTYQPFITVPPTSGQYGQVYNIVGTLPDYRNSGINPAEAFVGDKIFVKSVKFRFQTRQFLTVGTDRPMHYRASLISTTSFDELVSPLTNSQIPITWYEPTTTVMQLTAIRFDPSKIKILATKRWKTDPRATSTEVDNVSIFYKFNRWFTSENESNSVPRFFGLRGNGKQYYIMIEAWDPTGATILSPSISQLYIDQILYFKDA